MLFRGYIPFLFEIAGDKIEELERELTEANDLARRYRDIYLSQKGQTPRQTPAGEAPPGGGDYQKEQTKVTEDELDDDEAVFKRHVYRLAETRSMLTTSPIRIQDIIRKNEVFNVPVNYKYNNHNNIIWNNCLTPIMIPILIHFTISYAVTISLVRSPGPSVILCVHYQ